MRFLKPAQQRRAERAWEMIGPGARRWLDRGLDLLFPPICSSCGCELESWDQRIFLCRDCRDSLVDNRPACRRCGSSLPFENHGHESCEQCRHRRVHFSEVVRLGRYDDALRTAVLSIKDVSHQPLAVALGQWLAQCREASLARLQVQVVVPIPMHWSRRAWRGTNSAEILAQRLARNLHAPMAGHLLTRRRATQPQASLSPAERRRNVRGAFQASRHRDLKGARVLLVDDIMTTGATVGEAAKMLIDAGAEFVAAAVLARAEGGL